jgi:tetratricopeptide (TPR) repeat protein
MKFLLSLLFTFFFIFTGISQENSQPEILQKLETLYSNSEPTSEDIDQMITLCDELSVYDPDLSLAHLKKIKIRLKKVTDINNVTFYCSQLARNYTIIREFDQGLEAIDKLYEEYEDNLDRLQKIHFKIAKLTILDAKGDFDECLALIEELLPQTEAIKNDYVKHYQAVMYNVKGSIFSIQRGKYKDAVASYLQVLRLYKESKDEENNIAMTYNRLGLLYENIEEYPKSVSYFLEGIKVLENTPPKSATDVYNLLILYSNLGNVYKKLNFLNKALHYQNEAFALAEKVDSAIDRSRILYNIGSIYLEKDEFEKAIEYLLTSQEMCELLEIKEGVMHNHLALGEAYMRLGNYEEAQKHYDIALIYVKELSYPKGEVSIYKDYSELYKKLGDYNKALEYHTLYYNKEKELLGIETQEAIAQLEIEYETELKDEEIKRISYEYSIKKSENQKLIIGFISLLIITGGIIFFLIYRNKTLRDLYERNVELMNSFKNKSYAESSTLQVEESLEHNDDDNLKVVFNKLLFSLENEKVYKDSELTLSKLASIIKSNEKYVSAAISTYTNMNYNNFINSYRIQEAKILIYENNGMNINEVMYASGFNSRTTFYDAFKKHTGMSPKQFKDMKGYSQN